MGQCKSEGAIYWTHRELLQMSHANVPTVEARADAALTKAAGVPISQIKFNRYYDIKLDRLVIKWKIKE